MERGVGQVVDRHIWDVEVASSSLVTPIGLRSPNLSQLVGDCVYGDNIPTI